MDLGFKHCYDYIDDEAQPDCLREFLDVATGPAHGMMCTDGKRPELYAQHNGRECRVVMASRLGDVGISYDLGREHGYDKRVAVSDLSNFNGSPPSSHTTVPQCQ